MRPWVAQNYGKRFHYENFAPGYRSREMKTALGRLESAMIVTRVSATSSTTLPLVARPRSAPKLLSLDVGLALDSIGLLLFEVMRNAPLHTILDGRAAELFVGQQLPASQSGPRRRCTSGVTAPGDSACRPHFPLRFPRSLPPSMTSTTASSAKGCIAETASVASGS